MRRALVVLLVGCGRLGFDASGPPEEDAYVPGPGDRNDLDFTTCPSDLVLVGDATCANGELVLTPDELGSVGAVWIATPYAPASSFELELEFAFSTASASGADGVAVTFHDDPRGLEALGPGGGNLGYGGIAPSVALEFDPHITGGEVPDFDHVGFSVDGDNVSTAVAEVTLPVDDGTPFTLWIDYDHATTTFEAFLARSPPKPASALLSVQHDLTRLGSQLWLGVTASTGGQSQAHRLRRWRVDVTP